MDKRSPLAIAEGLVDPFLRDLEAIVNIDSGTYTPAGVERVAAYLQPRFEQVGCAVALKPGKLVERATDPTQSDKCVGPNLLATQHGNGKCRVVLLGHMDTVYPEGAVCRRPFEVRDNGRAYGPGVCDMKSGLVVGLYALRVLAELGLRPYSKLTFLCYSDEEEGSPASRPLIKRLARTADVVLVLEPAPGGHVDRVTVARKGLLRYWLHVQGEEAHAGEPEKGVNAVLQLAHHVIAMQALSGSIEGMTVNVGMAKGGHCYNQVPREAIAEIDVRFATKRDIPDVKAALRRARAVAAKKVPGAITTHSERVTDYPFEQSTLSAGLFERAAKVADEMGTSLGTAITGGCSDGNTAAAVGYAAVLDGLGLAGGNEHKLVDEYVELASIAPRVALLAGLLMRLGEAPLLASNGR